MTWSIVAHDVGTGHTAVAVASRFFAVGALCPHITARHGGLSTQALVNPLYGPQGRALLEQGLSAAEVIARLTGPDAGRDVRQVHAVDGQGRPAAHTGRACVEWCGHLAAPGVSVAGNMLTGPEVLEATLATFIAGAGLPFGKRVLLALKAGEDAGGDKRGRQSATLRVHRGEPYPALDIRSDDHAAPIDELFRLYEVAHQRFVPFSAAFATTVRPDGELDRPAIEAGVEAWLARRAAGSAAGDV